MKEKILSAIEAGLRKERPSGGVHITPTLEISGRASTLSKDCLRALWYEARGFERADVSLNTEAIFETGHFWHQRVREWLVEGGITLENIEQEVRYSVPGLSITGHVDGVIVHEGKRFLLDIKSASSYGFANSEEEAGKGSYARQLAIYAAALSQMGTPVDGALLLYISKEGKGEPSGIMAARGTEDKIETVAKVIFLDSLPEDALSRLDVIRSEAPPPPLPPALDKDGNEIIIQEKRENGEKQPFKAVVWPWQCSYCGFVKVCRPEAKGALLRSSQRKDGITRYLQEEAEPRGPFDKFVLYTPKTGDHDHENK